MVDRMSTPCLNTVELLLSGYPTVPGQIVRDDRIEAQTSSTLCFVKHSCCLAKIRLNLANELRYNGPFFKEQFKHATQITNLCEHCIRDHECFY